LSGKILPLLKKTCVVGKKDSFKADKSFLGVGARVASLESNRSKLRLIILNRHLERKRWFEHGAKREEAEEEEDAVNPGMTQREKQVTTAYETW